MNITVIAPRAPRAISKRLTHLTVGIAALAWSLSAIAQVNPFERGPAPTEAALEAAAGPFAVASTTSPSPTGFRAGTVYYPSAANQGSFGLVVLAPGFTATQTYYKWLATRAASHGFVVINMDTTTVLDQPESRGKQMMKALQQVVTLSKTASTPYFGKVDGTRLAVMGHSMGGGGTLAAARDNPTLKAAVPLTPWHTTKDFTGVKVPTMIVACETDVIAPNDTHSEKFYASFPVTLKRSYLEIAGADHLCPTSLANAEKQTIITKMTVSWLKRFVDNDTRYVPFTTSVDDTIVKQYVTGGF